jgi:hypothetical protein
MMRPQQEAKTSITGRPGPRAPVTVRKIVLEASRPATGPGASARISASVPSATRGSALQDEDAARDLLDQVEQVRAHDDRGAAAGALDDRRLHAADAERIEAGERLVEEQRARLVQEAAGDRELLLHAARELAGQQRRPCR